MPLDVIKLLLAHPVQAKFREKVSGEIANALSHSTPKLEQVTSSYLTARYRYLVEWEKEHPNYFQHIGQKETTSHLKKIAKHVGLEWPSIDTQSGRTK
jgi:hypothetical protein